MPVRSDVFEPARSSELGKTVSLMQTKLPLFNYDMRHNCPGRLNEWPPAVTWGCLVFGDPCGSKTRLEIEAPRQL